MSKLTAWPDSGFIGVIDLVMARSASPVMMGETDELLSEVSGSGSFAVTLAVLASAVPADAGSRVPAIATVATWPEASVAIEHVTVPSAIEHVPADGVAVGLVSSGGRGSLTLMPVASEGPLLVAVRVKVAGSPAIGTAGVTDFTIARSAGWWARRCRRRRCSSGRRLAHPTLAVLVIELGAEPDVHRHGDIGVACGGPERVAAGAGNSLGDDAAAPAGSRGAGHRERRRNRIGDRHQARRWRVPGFDTDSVNPDEPPGPNRTGVGLGHPQVGGGHRDRVACWYRSIRRWGWSGPRRSCLRC